MFKYRVGMETTKKDGRSRDETYVKIKSFNSNYSFMFQKKKKPTEHKSTLEEVVSKTIKEYIFRM